MKTRSPVTRVGKDRPHPHRARKTPRWLLHSSEVQTRARQRCLMVLSVLSGEQPVTEAVAEAQISRAAYYQMETRALKAMLMALNPAATSTDAVSAVSAQVTSLQAQLKRLQQEKRRAQRLLLLTRKSLRLPPIPTRRGRPPKRAPTPAQANPTTGPGDCSP